MGIFRSQGARTGLITVVLATSVLATSLTHANDHTNDIDMLIDADDFQALGQLMRERKTPLLLEIKSEHCPYCQRLEAEQLRPMLRNTTYTDKILIRKFELGGSREIKDFDGKTLTAEQFSKTYKASLAPTLLFLDADGKEIAKRMLGYASPDYFGAYLDTAIETASKSMREN